MNNMPRRRIFISSLMQGYGQIRDAAARGIERAGCEPVRAEDFPAAGTAPRTACLDGVASCDGIVVILGARYGSPTAVGISATEEEYREAVQRKIPILPFLEDIEREPRQAEFVRSLEQYIGGHWRKTFQTPEELARLVEQALGQAGSLTTGGAEVMAEQRLGNALGNRPLKTQGIVWLQTVWTTLREEEVLDPTQLVSADFQRQVYKLAHDGPAPLFAYEQPKQADVDISRLRVNQSDATRRRGGCDLVVLDLYTNGTVSIAHNVTRMQDHDQLDLGALYRIEPDHVLQRLRQAWDFAARWWEYHDPYGRHDPLLTQAALHDIEMHRLEKNPGHPVNSVVGLGMSQKQNPLLVYDAPRRIARADLCAPGAEIQRVVNMLQLRFDTDARR
jgi:Domain of unknown function (DUF4062)